MHYGFYSQKINIKWNNQVHKMWCLKHIVNLVVFVFIYNNFYNNKMPAEDVNIE